MLLAQEASIGSVEDGSYIGSDISQVDWQTEQTMDSSLSRVVQLQTSGHKFYSALYFFRSAEFLFN